MSTVLRKKIEARAGIPTAVLHLDEFWQTLQKHVAGWIGATLGIEAETVLETRVVMPGTAASAQLDGLSSYVYDSSYSPGLCAIAVDEFTATLNASQRLQQPLGEMGGVSALFRKLLLETPASGLWNSIIADLSGHMSLGAQAPVADYATAAGGFAQTQRYLMIGFSAPHNDDRARVWVVFHLDYILRNVSEFERQAARMRNTPSGQGSETLRASVKSSMITIEGVLHRLTLTIGQCSRFEVGQLIELPEVDTTRVSLRAETVNGNVDIGLCEMGVWKNQRALKLTTPIHEPFTRELANL
ncbi:MAG: FliM/FliN family flagellar motor switch protein [Pseudorhizobium sp.]